MTSTSENNRLAVTVAYDGTGFEGWQVQPQKRTVQGELENALGVIRNAEPPRIHGSGRTDTGVHARGQVFHMEAVRDYSPEKWREALNGVLPPDIRILGVRPVDSDFHARFSAVSKQYRYFIHPHRVMPPELRFTRHPVRKPLNLPRMKEAAERLEGTRDFLSFSAGRGAPEELTVRNLMSLRILEEVDSVCLIAEADGFMYKMVRQLAGALIRVGLEELKVSQIQQMLDLPRRNHLAPTAPACGLFLWKVTYPDWSSDECV